MPGLDERQKQLRDDFVNNRGYWSPLWQQVLEFSPDFFEAYSSFSSVPWKTGPLEPKLKELVYLAVNIATNHLYLPGARTHMANAIARGATREEILEVIQLVSVLGIHSCTEGIPILLEELERAGQPFAVGEETLDDDARALKRNFQETRGYWSPFWDSLLALSPGFFEAYLKLSSVPWVHGTLEPKVKEFIYIAIDAATTHLYRPGLRIHMRNALAHGASREEIMEVLMLVSTIGIHSCNEGVPMLVEELERAEKKDG